MLSPPKRRVVQGLELLNSYGPCPNSKLLLDYGLSILDNPHDTVRLGLELRPPADDALVDRRRALLRRGNCSPYPTFQLRRGEAPVDALAFLRVALAPADVLSAKLPRDDVLGVLDDEEKVVAYLDGLLETVGDDCGLRGPAAALASRRRGSSSRARRATRRAIVVCRSALRNLVALILNLSVVARPARRWL